FTGLQIAGETLDKRLIVLCPLTHHASSACKAVPVDSGLFAASNTTTGAALFSVICKKRVLHRQQNTKLRREKPVAIVAPCFNTLFYENF
ncbi:MAG: hypothetical protein ACRDAV_12370, partial [Plesiomonas shigelloides]